MTGTDPTREKARKLFESGMKLNEIASRLEVPEGTVRSWKNRYKWKCNATQGEKVQRCKKKHGAPKGNKNALGNKGGHGTRGNANTVKNGLHSRYLPQDTLELFNALDLESPLDILWFNIKIAYTAIVRAQQIAHVKDKDDFTQRVITESETSTSYKFEEAWEKQEKFLVAQARAQSELRYMIKQYDELLHHDWELATEEQRARIAAIKAKTQDDEPDNEDDGFMDAMTDKVGGIWQEE